MVERFLKQTSFSSVEDYNKNLEFIIPEHFNFAYDVMDEWAKEAPEKLALLWTNDEGAEIRTTFAQLKEQTDQAASYLQSLGIQKGDPVMLILKRRYEWWLCMLALCKLGAVVIPASPQFYSKPSTVEDLVDTVVVKILKHLGAVSVERCAEIVKPWKGDEPDALGGPLC